jgi:hypothetical protein
VNALWRRKGVQVGHRDGKILSRSPRLGIHPNPGRRGLFCPLPDLIGDGHRTLVTRDRVQYEMKKAQRARRSIDPAAGISGVYTRKFALKCKTAKTATHKVVQFACYRFFVVNSPKGSVAEWRNPVTPYGSVIGGGDRLGGSRRNRPLDARANARAPPRPRFAECGKRRQRPCRALEAGGAL